ncbi:hypothetical protein [Clostridium tyrobutyricum]|uniref:hypothetical protein n=1 Tax=Clostridium tyrobutyricum TaxID=1519 RepID=UPI001C38BB3D|nr:hypothetical protein [Clostridium tyrobutyricum]MBV4422797.1 hypothetical protein [Clostridium tyrobutyricum]
MAQFRYVYTSFWEDPDIVENFTPEDRLFFIYLLTNPHTTQIGIYKITKKLISFELGYSIESVNALIARFEEHHKVIKYNTQTRELAIKNWGKFNLNKGGKPVVDCIKKEFKAVEDKSLLAYIARNIKNPNMKLLFMQELSKYYSEISEEIAPESDDTLDDRSDDSSCGSSTIRGQKENENKKENDNKNINNIYSPKEQEEIQEYKSQNLKRDSVPYEKIVHAFNSLCPSMPKVQKISKQRKSVIKARWQEYSSLDTFLKVFKMAETSDFLSGRDGKWSACSFDWIIKSQNFIKVMEGNYRNKTANNSGQCNSNSTFNNFKQREYDFKDLEKKLLGY